MLSRFEAGRPPVSSGVARATLAIIDGRHRPSGPEAERIPARQIGDRRFAPRVIGVHAGRDDPDPAPPCLKSGSAAKAGSRGRSTSRPAERESNADRGRWAIE
jgi:hypothetical protein